MLVFRQTYKKAPPNVRPHLEVLFYSKTGNLEQCSYITKNIYHIYMHFFETFSYRDLNYSSSI